VKTPYIRNGSITRLIRSGNSGWKVRSYAITPGAQGAFRRI